MKEVAEKDSKETARMAIARGLAAVVLRGGRGDGRLAAAPKGISEWARAG